MRILVVDDEQVRHDGYIKRHPDDLVVSAYNNYQAMGFLEEHEQFDIAYLDYDMGSGWPDGEDMAKSILGLPRAKWPKRIVVHTSSKDGARLMIDIFATACLPAVYRPFRP